MRVKAANNANALAATSAWATEMHKLLIKELENARTDEVLVAHLCNIPFKSIKAKKAHRTKLNELRDQSQFTIYTVVCMLAAKERIQATKSARDKIDDSFWDHTDLEFPKERGEQLFSEYKTKAAAHVTALRELMQEVSSDRRAGLVTAVKHEPTA